RDVPRPAFASRAHRHQRAFSRLHGEPGSARLAANRDNVSRGFVSHTLATFEIRAYARSVVMRQIVGLSLLLLTLLSAPVVALAGPATPNPICPHLDTWNPKGIKGPNRIDMVIVKFPAGSASQRGGSCSILVDASYERERERSYSFMA